MTCADGCCAVPAVAPDRRAVLVRRVRLLVAATITYNVVEAVVALIAGTAASSGALIGFGLDSVIEVASAVAVAWQFSGRDPEARERLALKAIQNNTPPLSATIAQEGYTTVSLPSRIYGAGFRYSDGGADFSGRAGEAHWTRPGAAETTCRQVTSRPAS